MHVLITEGRASTFWKVFKNVSPQRRWDMVIFKIVESTKAVPDVTPSTIEVERVSVGGAVELWNPWKQKVGRCTFSFDPQEYIDHDGSDNDVEGSDVGAGADADIGGALLDDVGEVECEDPPSAPSDMHESSADEGPEGGPDVPPPPPDPPPPPPAPPVEPVTYYVPGGHITYYPARAEFNAVCNRCTTRCLITRTSHASMS
eukprot:3010445-Pyramimonas_sp.AAC.1